MVKAWASMKSFQPKAGRASPDDDAGSPLGPDTPAEEPAHSIMPRWRGKTTYTPCSGFWDQIFSRLRVNSRDPSKQKRHPQTHAPNAALAASFNPPSDSTEFHPALGSWPRICGAATYLERNRIASEVPEHARPRALRLRVQKSSLFRSVRGATC